MKKLIARFLRSILPWRYYKLFANGWIVIPSYYKTILDDAEKYFDMSLGDSRGKDILMMRKMGHIIDKGLHREDAAPGHSRSIYNELKELVGRVAQTPYKDDPSYVWAASKLQAYELLQEHPDQFAPLHGDDGHCNMTYEDFFALIRARRSNRDFEEKAVSDDVVLKLKNVVNWAASSCNKQPIRLFTTNDPALASQCLKCCKGGTGFSAYIPSFWVFAADSRGYVWPSEMFLPTLDTSLGAQNVFLAAQTLGISGTILSWAQKDEEEDRRLRQLLNIPEEYVIVFCSVMGYARRHFATPVRKNPENDSL